MIHATLRMALPAERLQEGVGILRMVAERVKADPACLASHVYQDVQEDCVLMFEEFWKSAEDLHRHLRSNEYRNVLLLMEMATEPPEVCFNTVSGSEGMETIERARG